MYTYVIPSKMKSYRNYSNR